ncbi:MAG: 3-methyl-2-oxobutanoate hydroxymethyltransferase, partial [Thermomicrobiales bacterium]|nr:3-methyl-2-oxobutanoate hydroxymethyltransferase [Thermomicrobiales bacterium]
MSDSAASERRKLTAVDIRARKRGPKLTMLSLYDFPFARLAEKAGIDVILVGDSLGMVV